MNEEYETPEMKPLMKMGDEGYVSPTGIGVPITIAIAAAVALVLYVALWVSVAVTDNPAE